MLSTLDVISNGRIELGIGAGWHEEEYRQYGYDFPSTAVRIEQLDKAVSIIKAMWSKQKASFRGKYYTIKDAICNPKPVQKPHPTIMIGGSGEKYLLRVVAKLDNSRTTKEHRVSELLPWLFSYEDLDYYSEKMDYGDHLKSFKNESITREMIKHRIKTLKELTECYIDFKEPPLKRFCPQFTEFKKKFYNYSADQEFRPLAELYYVEPFSKGTTFGEIFSENFNGMWEIMMSCYTLVNMIMYSTNEDEFVQRIEG